MHPQLTRIITQGEILVDEPLSQHTTYGIGGAADIFVRPASRQELAGLLQYAARKNLPVTVLGSGSNCLVNDSGIRGLVISLAGTMKELRIQNGTVVAAAGVTLGHLVRRCLEAGLTGTEKLVGIPGTLGGALVMNAGAFGEQISTHLVQVRVLNFHGEEKVYDRQDIQFGYRSSTFRPDEIITEATFQFETGAPQKIAQLLKQVSGARKLSQPLNERSAGSVFKNPSSDISAGMLIEQAGLKGTIRGGAEISPEHGNFFINRRQATAQEMAFLIKMAARTVKQHFGIQLELEIRTLGFEPGFWEEAGLA
ncbi:MAG: UDP-N-acetylmuramate dehydrogenase [Fidelibacterota bacterium]|nr:MAG: UDP-N-acetylmuramate dehydrogenase [Candidatus Neomarinimicrobiota bacterium]